MNVLLRNLPILPKFSPAELQFRKAPKIGNQNKIQISKTFVKFEKKSRQIIVSYLLNSTLKERKNREIYNPEFKAQNFSDMTLLTNFQEDDDCKVSFKRNEIETSDKSNQFVLPSHKREYQKQ